MEPIFQYIDQNIQKNGKLIEEFSLDGYRKNNSLFGFIDGAEDGIMLYHIDTVVDNEFVEDVIKIINKVNENNTLQIYQEIEDVYSIYEEKQIKTLPNIDAIIRQIQKNIENIGIHPILKLAITIIINTYNIETMKLGIALLGLADVSQIKDIVEIIEKLALCEEFTLYALHVITLWNNANEVIFMLAKKINGWGKIHLVNKLEPKNEYIKEWLITEGCFNQIDLGYLAKNVADKVNLLDVLHRENLNREQLKGINDIIEGLLEDANPFIGIEEVKNSTELFESYLEKFKNVIDDINFYHAPILISKYLYNKKEKSEKEKYIFMKIELLLESKESIETLRKEILKGESPGLKQAIEVISIDTNIDLKNEVYHVFAKDPFNNYHAFSYLLKFEEYKEKVIQLMQNSQDFKLHYEIPEPILLSSDNYHTNLMFIIQDIEEYPFICNDIVASGLMSRVMETRNAALNTIKKWKETSKKEVNKFPKVIVEALKELQKTEIIKSYKEIVNQLLEIDEDLSSYVEPEILIKDTSEINNENINIDLFSSELDLLFMPQIVIRGKEYYKSNMIYSYVHSDNKYIMYIQGSKFGTEYEVEIDLDGTILKNMQCNCPYQDNCKHEYAAILWLREKLNEKGNATKT